MMNQTPKMVRELGIMMTKSATMRRKAGSNNDNASGYGHNWLNLSDAEELKA